MRMGTNAKKAMMACSPLYRYVGEKRPQDPVRGVSSSPLVPFRGLHAQNRNEKSCKG